MEKISLHLINKQTMWNTFISLVLAFSQNPYISLKYKISYILRNNQDDHNALCISMTLEVQL